MRDVRGTPFVYDLQVMERDLRSEIIAHMVKLMEDGQTASSQPDPNLDFGPQPDRCVVPALRRRLRAGPPLPPLPQRGRHVPQVRRLR